MNAPSDEVLSVRVRALERRQRFLVLVTVLLTLALVASELVPRRSVTAERFSIVDASGREMGFWGVRDVGPALVLRDDDGIWSAWVQVEPDGSFLRLTGTSDAVSSRLSISGDTGRLELSGPEEGSTVLEGGEVRARRSGRSPR